MPFERGVVGMARSQSPDSANCQFFIMFAPAPHLNGQYTVVGERDRRHGRGRRHQARQRPDGERSSDPDVMADVEVVED